MNESARCSLPSVRDEWNVVFGCVREKVEEERAIERVLGRHSLHPRTRLAASV
jgi:hypothetical protein